MESEVAARRLQGEREEAARRRLVLARLSNAVGVVAMGGGPPSAHVRRYHVVAKSAKLQAEFELHSAVTVHAVPGRLSAISVFL
jgi:hypothetical protein